MDLRLHPGPNPRTITIVGGGTAGWMTAALLSKLFVAGYAINVIESDEIGIVGVGEATIPAMRTYLGLAGIDEAAMMRATQATYKLGIEFVDWRAAGSSYIHGFGKIGQDLWWLHPHQMWLKAAALGRARPFDHYAINCAAARRNRFAPPDPAQPGSPMADLDYAYHFDAASFAPFLRREAEARGVTRIEGRITDTVLDAGTGHVDHVLLADGRTVAGNLFNTAQIERLTNDVRSDTTIVFGQNGAPAWNESFRDVETLRGLVTSLRQGGNVWLLADDTPVPFTDQFNFGVRKRFGKVQTALAFAYNRSQDRFQYVRGNRLPDGSYTSQGDFWVIDLFPPEGQLAGYNGKLNIGSSRGEADYKAVYVTVDKPFSEEDGYGFTGSLTVSEARSNNGTELGSDEFFAGPNQTQFGWQRIAGLEKYRFVGTGIVAGPWGTTFSSTVTAASGPAFGFIRFPENPPPNACCVANLGGVSFPRKEFAFVNVDARVAKTFTTPWGHEITADLGVFNLFDSVNRQYTAWGAGQSPRREENATTGNARTFQAGLKYKF